MDEGFDEFVSFLDGGQGEGFGGRHCDGVFEPGPGVDRGSDPDRGVVLV